MLREAADLLDSDAAMQIRYFETLSTLSKERCPKVMFLPINDKTFEKKWYFITRINMSIKIKMLLNILED